METEELIQELEKVVGIGDLISWKGKPNQVYLVLNVSYTLSVPNKHSVLHSIHLKLLSLSTSKILEPVAWRDADTGVLLFCVKNDIKVIQRL